MYKLLYSPQAKKDAKKLVKSGLKDNAELLLGLIETEPFAYPPEYEILKGKLKGFVSRKINKQHRLVYQVLKKEKIVKIIRMWTHYE
jgi:Txe/YoeB family toxin of toxin-antitoxin system